MVESCSRSVEIQKYGLCRPHYKRLKRYGDPTGGGPSRVRCKTYEERRDLFLSRFTEVDSGCMEYTRARDVHGYGRVVWEGRPKLAHRVVYELLVGPIPDGMVVMHVCDNPPCGNPKHLQLGTQGDNHRDMMDKGRGYVPPAEKWTQCGHGHPLTPDNLYITPSTGNRECLTCVRRRSRARYHKVS